MASAKLWSTVKNYQKSLNPFVYAAAKIKRSKYMFGYRKKTLFAIHGSRLLLRYKRSNRKAAGDCFCFNSKQWATHIYALCMLIN